MFAEDHPAYVSAASSSPSATLLTGKPSAAPAPPPAAPGPTQPSVMGTDPSPTYPTDAPTPEPTPTPTAPPGLAVMVDRNATNCTGTGFAPDPVDCNVYHRCDWGIRTTYVCPEPLHFSPSRNQCDWPEQAGCANAVGDNVKAVPGEHPYHGSEGEGRAGTRSPEAAIH